MSKISRNFLRYRTTVSEAYLKILSVDLLGRDYTTPFSLTQVELKSLLWTALDLKYLSKIKSRNIPCLNNINVTALLDGPNITQIPLKLASNFLGTKSSIIVDAEWSKNHVFISDLGRLLALSSHIIFCQTKEQKHIEEIADGANIPVVGINSCEYNLIKTLADLMTIFEHFNRFKYLTFSWIGKPNSLFNTYLLILPQLKMNIKYFLTEDKCNDRIMEIARKYSQKNNSEIHETYGSSETVYRANIVATSAHNSSGHQITLEDLQESALNWIFLHEMPRTDVEVKTEVINHKNSLTWKSHQNLQWIYAALITRLLTSYNHTIKEPAFDSDEFVKNECKL